jgi:hypothetical protein
MAGVFFRVLPAEFAAMTALSLPEQLYCRAGSALFVCI